jgi:signal peptidase I
MKLKDYLQVFVFTILIAIVSKLFVLDAVIVSSSSMERTLTKGDLVLVNKLVFPSQATTANSNADVFPFSFPLKRIARGDVVVFRYPGERDEPGTTSSTDYVKRCIGLPGDTLAIRAGKVYVNGIFVRASNDLDRPHFESDFVDSRLFPKGDPNNLDFYGPLVVPSKGEVIALNAKNIEKYQKLIHGEGHDCFLSADGAVYLDGRPAGSYRIQRDYLFMLGDNFYDSSDSRFWGFVPEENVTGEAMVIYWSRTLATGRDGQSSSIQWDRIGTIVR